MKIKSLKASIHRIPIIVPLLDEGALKRDMVFCEVETDDGIIGWGVTGNYMAAAVVAALEKHIFPVVEGMDPRDTEAIHWAVWWKLNPRTMTGVISNALSALDIALWDIHGKQAGRTVAQLLGGHRDWSSTYITFGLHQYDRDQLVEAAKMFVAEGNNALKMVVAVDEGGWREDARRIRAVRAAVGDDVDLMIDANFIFTPVEARMLCRAVEDCNLSWFEEPLHQNDARALRDLRRYTRIPIAAGQNEGHRWRHRDLVDNQAVDILQPNCCYNGGYTETRKIAHMAQAFNLPIANGAGWPAFNMHTMAGLMNGGSVEFHVATGYMGSVVFNNTPAPENNRVKIPDAPGLGFEANYDVLNDTRIESP